jgi:hypothetical protein
MTMSACRGADLWITGMSAGIQRQISLIGQMVSLFVLIGEQAGNDRCSTHASVPRSATA